MKKNQQQIFVFWINKIIIGISVSFSFFPFFFFFSCAHLQLTTNTLSQDHATGNILMHIKMIAWTVTLHHTSKRNSAKPVQLMDATEPPNMDQSLYWLPFQWLLQKFYFYKLNPYQNINRLLLFFVALFC